MSIKSDARTALRMGMEKLLDGKPERSEGHLTWNNVCLEAGIPRSTAARATDVIGEWKTALEQRPHRPRVERVSTTKVAMRTVSVAEANQGLRDTIRVMANHIQALSLALEQKDVVIHNLTAGVTTVSVFSKRDMS
jgi:hypothetical protein